MPKQARLQQTKFKNIRAETTGRTQQWRIHPGRNKKRAKQKDGEQKRGRQTTLSFESPLSGSYVRPCMDAPPLIVARSRHVLFTLGNAHTALPPMHTTNSATVCIDQRRSMSHTNSGGTTHGCCRQKFVVSLLGPGGVVVS